MARIAGVNLPNSKRVVIALTRIIGIGNRTADVICSIAEIPSAKRVHELNDEEVNRIRKVIEELGSDKSDVAEANHLAAPLKVEGDLRREVQLNIKKLIDMKCYRGLRHVRKLPVHGQRTKTNARTRKGKAVAIAGKKKAVK